MTGHLKSFIQNKTARAIGIIFACCGFIFGSWASLIPYIKEKFHLDEAELGLLLLSMPVGVLFFNPVSVIFIRRYGSVLVSMLAVILMGINFMLPILMPSIVFVVLTLVLAGASFSVTNVAMNTCASALEESSGLRIMSSCHGMWSLGAMGGALFSGFSLQPLANCCNQLLPPQALYVILQSLLVILIVFLIRNHFQSIASVHASTEDGPKMNLRSFKPGKELWMIISICLCTYLTEGTIADWSAVYLREIVHASETIAGRGFAVYAFFMAGGRFVGDELIARFGNMRVLRAGGILVVIGLAVVVASQTHFMAMPGFMLVGAGISLASPILYQASARVKGLAPGVGLATMNTFAMAAFLGGPVLIGFIAQSSNLRIAFAVVAIVAFVWVLQTHRIIKVQSTKYDI